MNAILALDQGTTGSMALMIDHDGRIVSRGYREIPQHFPTPGLVEHDADDLYRCTIEAAREAIEHAGETPIAIGITNQRETVVAWERETGKPVGRAIVWQDRRTVDICRSLESRHDWIAERTGLVPDPYFSGSKLQWRLEREPELKKGAEAGDIVFGTVDTWLVARLTGGAEFVTDHTNASRTMLYGLETGDWDDELLGLFGVPRQALAEIRPSSTMFGVATPDHFGKEIPIAGVAGDQQAALYGQGCWTAGSTKNTYGTGAFLLFHTGEERPRSQSGLLATRACGPRGEPRYALEGSVFIAGAAVQWLRDGLGLVESASSSEALARAVPNTGGVFFVPAFVGLGAPHWESEARGTLVGLTRGTGRAHLVRAALEAMAYGTREMLDAMRIDTGLALDSLQVDGGASANDWLMQFQANLIGVPVTRPETIETTALGAAVLAGLEVGFWSDGGDALTRLAPTRFDPDPAASDLDHEGWRRAVETALFWARFGREG